ncbi:transporter substrate-binding domain-containing protein [Pseudorhodoplanes sp.]|uniref:transporter substrate-binding domain-containing protein n=1 Tax=Pseudorhodoplanes sp. TaxID=1934341 RepID=UPI002CA52C45|nr:transporter substrate-binding domain-containing protein [Pseudorhodoplanes sp.]HWV55801.1 transporter substrate-binding domain-containing protein [Pseudorhodoplanes sp.]
MLCAVAVAGSFGIANADQLATIREKGVIRVATDMSVPPYGTLDAELKPIGSDVEAAQLLAESLGVKLEFVPVTGANRVPFLLTGKADVVMATFSISKERDEVVDFSLPYGAVQIIVAAPKADQIAGFADLKGRRIGVTRGTTADNFLTEGAPDADIVRFDDDSTLTTAIKSGQAEIAVVTGALVPILNETRPENPLEQKFLIRSSPYAVGLRENEPELKTYLDAWVTENMENGKLKAIYKKWVRTDLPNLNPSN